MAPSAKVAMPFIVAQAVSMILKLIGQPLPSPSRMPRSKNGRMPSASMAMR